MSCEDVSGPLVSESSLSDSTHILPLPSSVPPPNTALLIQEGNCALGQLTPPFLSLIRGQSQETDNRKRTIPRASLEIK